MSNFKVGDIVIRSCNWDIPYPQDGAPGYLGEIISLDCNYKHVVKIKWFMRESDETNSYYINRLTIVDSRLADNLNAYRKLIDLLNRNKVIRQSRWTTFLESYLTISKQGISLVSLLGNEICQWLDEVDSIEKLSQALSKSLHSPVPDYQKYCRKLLEDYVNHCLDLDLVSSDFFLKSRDFFSWTKFLEKPKHKFSAKDQLLFRDCLLIQNENQDHDWFGYQQLWKKTSRQTFFCPLDQNKKCAYCDDSLSKEETEYTHGLQTDCGCVYHVECGLEMVELIQGLAKSDPKSLNLSCLGCLRENNNDDISEMTTEFYRNLLAIKEYHKFRQEQRPKKVSDLVKFFDVEGELIDFVKNLLKINDFKEEIEFLNQKMIRRFELQNALWVTPCPGCSWNYLTDPEIERYGKCQKCKKHFLITGTIKHSKNEAARPELILLVKNNSDMNFCKHCFKIINKNYGCSDMLCPWCNRNFSWNWNRGSEKGYSKIHF